MTGTPTLPRPLAAPTDDALLDAFAQLASTVTVVTTYGADGPVGMTASTVCSLSMHPPMLLLCAANASRTLEALLRHGRFAVHALHSHHAGVAAVFAHTDKTAEHRFAVTAHQHIDGLPILAQALATFTCDLHQTHPGGDHTIVIGRIRSLHRSIGRPLLWHARGYHQPTPVSANESVREQHHEPNP